MSYHKGIDERLKELRPAQAEKKLTLPLREGQRVVCRDGVEREVIFTGAPVGDPPLKVARLSCGHSIFDNGCDHRQGLSEYDAISDDPGWTPDEDEKKSKKARACPGCGAMQEQYEDSSWWNVEGRLHGANCEWVLIWNRHNCGPHKRACDYADQFCEDKEKEKAAAAGTCSAGTSSPAPAPAAQPVVLPELLPTWTDADCSAYIARYLNELGEDIYGNARKAIYVHMTRKPAAKQPPPDQCDGPEQETVARKFWRLDNV